MAVPTGEYRLTASIDLSPVFGSISARMPVTLTRPPDDILDIRLREILDQDEEVRRKALTDLGHFPGAGERIVPAVLALLRDKDRRLRSSAIRILGKYPKNLTKHCDSLLSFVTGKMPARERGDMALLMARSAPKRADVLEALHAGFQNTTGGAESDFRVALDTYRKRHRIRPGKLDRRGRRD